MASRRPSTNACYVEREDLLKTLLLETTDSNQEHTYDPNRSQPSLALSKGSMRSGGSRVHQQQQPQNQSQQQGGAAGSAVVSEQALRRRQQEEADKRAIEQALQAKKEAGNKHLGKLNLRIKESMRFLDGVDRDLNLVSETKRTKTRRAFEDWNANVHGKINHRISVALNKISSKELHEKKLADYQTFIDITNRKPAIFRDIIIEAEYDPLEANRRCIKASMGKLKDPTQIDSQKAAAENSMLPPSGSHNKQQLCKDTLDVRMWAKEKILGTPYGMFASLIDDGKADPSSSGAASCQRGKSNVVWDDFDFPRGAAGIKAVNSEMPPGKPRCRTVYADPSKIYPLSPQVRGALLKIQPPF